MPVRLNLYQKVTIGQESAKHPVYTLTQDNEAIYVQLNEEIVRNWLIRIRCQEANQFKTGSVGGRLLECVFAGAIYQPDFLKNNAYSFHIDNQILCFSLIPLPRIAADPAEPDP